MSELTEGINLLHELDNISKIHALERESIEEVMLEFATRITKCLAIERISIWLFNQNKTSLISIGEYDKRNDLFKKDTELLREDFPVYFEHVESDRIILAPNMAESEATQELYLDYSLPNNIISLMDVPLRMAGKIIGVMCFEKTGSEQRHFNQSEQTFAFSCATVFASNMEARHRRAEQYQLEKVLKEKEVLIKEMNHRVKNNFSILISLLRITKSKIKNEEGIHVIKDFEQRIFSMLTLHEILSERSNYGQVNVSNYLNKLITEFKQSYPEMAPRIVADIEPLEIDFPSKAVLNIGLVVSEIFTNTLKHVPENESRNLLKIDFYELDDKYVILRIQDGGIGFDFKENLKKNSLGLSLIEDLLGEINAETQFPTKSNPVYSMQFKKSNL